MILAHLPRHLLLAAMCWAVIGIAARAAVAQQPVTVFAAASLKPALDEIAGLYQGKGALRLSYGGSSALARQIRYGAPAQIFISANPDWMDVLEAEGLVAPDTRADLLTNRLVLIGARDSTTDLVITPGFDLAGALGKGRLAMALVDAVPAGLYGKAALMSLGVWDAVRPKVAQVDSVTAALVLVALGEAPFGIVYATDASADPRVRVIDTFPADSHPPILYPAAILSDGDTAETRAFFAYLGDEAARDVFARHGFGQPGGGE